MAKKSKSRAKGKNKSRNGRYERFVMIAIVVVLVVIGLSLWGPLKKFRASDDTRSAEQSKKTDQAGKKKPAAEQSGKRPEKESPAKKDKKELAKREPAPAVSAPAKPARIVIVIDDLGQDLRPAQELAELPHKITFAVMPGLPQSKKVAELARLRGREVLLHLPMEHQGRNGKQAPGMLRSDMTPMDFLNTLADNLGSVPGVIGVNNHEGSLLTENTEAMKFLMAELKARNLFYLDSLTTPRSVAFATAREFGLKAARRDVFLDNDISSEAAIRKQLEELADLAREHGIAIGIGHPHPATISQLRKWLQTAKQRGIEVVPISKIVN